MSNTTNIIRQVRGLIKDTLDSTGRKVYIYYTDNKFLLPTSFVDSSTIQVYQNGDLLDTQDWSYSSTTNTVTISFITTGKSLTSGDNIEIKFSYYAKYSDAELTDYIESSLLYFTQKRYKKLFYMDSNDVIKTYNGDNPTKEEEYIIALISSINVDPQNVSLRTKECSMSAIESKSKSEQMDAVFSNWLKSTGTIEFFEDDNNYDI